ncbi:hypothetical protein FJZ18_02695 [Candidatus Pacearchaeota archaeon]|nr:hypothetical protein [Candidatus Pacearchaeota archaeon]
MAKKEGTQRPILVTIICILGFIGFPLSLIAAVIGMSAVSLVPNVELMPLWYSIFAIILALLYLPALIYIWKMKKIGLIAYTALAVIDYAVGFASGFASISGLVVSAIFIGLLYTQFKKMN